MGIVLVTGATGNVGSSVVRELSQQGEPVRAFVRDPARGRERLGEHVELAVGDLSDPGSVRRAMDGVDRVFLSSGDGPHKVEQETGVIDAAGEAGVRRIVKASTVGAEAGSPLPGFDWNGRIEDHLLGSGIPATILRSTFYMTNLLASAEPVRSQGKLFAPANGGRIAMIDPADTGAVGAAVLASEGHEGATHVLSGPEAITYYEMAEALSAVAGRPVEFVDVPEEVARDGLLQADMPDWLVQHLTGAFRIIRESGLEETTDVVRVLTGHEPHSFVDFTHMHAALFREPGMT
jgi:uncharacterized protein YbjT (DUF2867 family)